MIVPFRVGDPAVRDAFLRHHLWEALAALREDAAPRWGRMSALQMVEHLSWVFNMSTGLAPVACLVPEARRQRFKAFLHDDSAMPREFRNPALGGGLPPARHEGLEAAIATLRVDVARFLDQGRDAPAAVFTHPVFGPLDTEEWSRSHFKHAYHHLLQFGLVDAVPVVEASPGA